MLHLAPLHCLLGVISRVSACQHCGYVQLRDGRARLWYFISPGCCSASVPARNDFIIRRGRIHISKLNMRNNTLAPASDAGLRVCVGMSTSVCAYRRTVRDQFHGFFFFVCLSNTHHCNHKQHIKATLQEINSCGLQHWQPVSSQLFSERLFFFFFCLKILLFVVNGNKRRGQTGRIVFLFSLNVLCSSSLWFFSKNVFLCKQSYFRWEVSIMLSQSK